MTGVVDQLKVPAGVPERSLDSVRALSRAALAGEEGLRVLQDGALAAVVGEAGGWQGQASADYADRCRELVARVSQLGQACSDAAEQVSRWAAVAGPARTVMQAALATIRAREPAGPIGQVGVIDLELGAALVAFRSAGQRFDEATWTAMHGLNAARDQIDDRSLSIGDQGLDFVATVWDRAVVAPATSVWGLSSVQAVTDPQQYLGNLRAAGTGAMRLVEDVFADPLAVVSTVADMPDWQRGRWGAGAGAAAALVVPGPKGLGAASEGVKAAQALEQVAKFDHLATVERGLAKAAPRLQSLDGLLTRADLAANEGTGFGHVVSRHLEVDKPYLIDRVTLGTLLDDGTRGHIPPSASRFHDLATAQEAIDTVLHDNEAAIREWATTNQLRKPLWGDFQGRSLGTVCRLVDDKPVFEDGSRVMVWLRKTVDGHVFLESAYVEVAP